jgi:hypothetical protein
LLAIGSVLTFCGTHAFGAIQQLPNPTTPPSVPGGNALVFGNFYVYSLGFLLNETGNQVFNVQSSPGQIADDVVILTGAGGTPVNTNFPGMDNAFSTPSGSGGSPYFATANNQISSGTPINPGVWTTSTSAMKSFLNGSQLAFYFNLNQENAGSNPTNIAPGGTTAPAQDLIAFGRVTLSGGGNTPLSFYLTSLNTNSLFGNFAAPNGILSASLNNGPQPNPALPGFNPPPDPITGLPASGDTNWAYVHGAITVDKTTGTFVHFGPPTAADGNNVVAVNQNLGANQAAFAMYNQQLSDLVTGVTANTYTTMTVDVELSGLDNGYEQLFILPTQVAPGAVTPEPASMAIWGLLGAIAVGAPIWRRWRNTAS